MNEEPQKEHRWLDKLVGDWTSVMECVMGPDQPTTTHRGTESVRSLGGLWTIGEGAGEMPEGCEMTSVMTLGYDPKAGRFVGTFIASVMTHMWTYIGSLDESGRVLSLDADGPSFSGEGMAKYQDRMEFVDDDHRILTSQFLGDDGEWHRFMTVHYRRKK
jgi:Protein of unknown function (DUF1579)